MPTPPPRSLADDLRARGDTELADLVRARPDLLHPVPADLTALASRAGSPASVAAALRDLDERHLQVVLAASLAGDPTSRSELVAAVAIPLSPGSPQREASRAARAAVDRLRAAALLWGSDRSLHLVGAARDLMVPVDRGPRLSALDPVVASYVADPSSLHELVGTAPEGARAALERLLSGTVIGSVVGARRPPDPDRSPVDWLLAHHLLVPFGNDRVVVPAEVADILRGIVPEEVPRLAAPQPAAAAPDPVRVESGAAGAAIDVLHGLSELGLLWAEDPPGRLRSGGIAQRDLTRTARALGVAESQVCLLIEVAAAAGLLAADSREVATVLPTTAFDAWLAMDPPDQHAMLLSAWQVMARGRSARPLDPDGVDPTLPALRQEVLATLDSAPGGWTADEVLAALHWRAPRRTDPRRDERARAVLDDLTTLGLLVSGSLTGAGRALAAQDAAGVVEALTRALPGRVDTLILQADLTAVVPGLPSADLAALLRSAADPESTGAASVYRFSEASIRRALESGRTAQDLIAELGARGTIPQPLRYLIEDVARRHAALRIGAAATYLRCDDPVVLASILADPAVAGLGLVALSDTVLASTQPPEHVLESLRQRGHHPQPEHGFGPIAGPRRARVHRAVEPPGTTVTPALAAAAVRAMRASDRSAAEAPARAGRGGETSAGASGASGRAARSGSAARGAPRGADGRQHPIPPDSPASVVAALRAAIAAEEAVWIGYADPSGVAGDRRVEPLRLAGGYLTALDLRTESVQSFAVARITGVQPG